MTTIANSSRMDTVRRLQTAMAVGYSAMGSWCLIHPSSVINLSLAAPYAVINRTTCLLMRCFGAQAVTAGLLLGTSSMNELSFASFGLSMIPYLFFNAYFGIGPGRGVFTPVLALDVVGNLFFGLGSAYCYRLLRQEHKEVREKDAKSK